LRGCAAGFFPRKNPRSAKPRAGLGGGAFAELSNPLIVDAVSRFGVFLVSEPTPPGITRRFHYLDAHALALYAALIKTEPFKPRQTRPLLVKQLAGLLFGDPVDPREAAARNAEVAKYYDLAARTPSGRAKFAGHMLKTHLARREEIRRDVYNASPFWWNRSASKNFAVFACDHAKLAVICADKEASPNASMAWLESIGARNWLNATRTFCEIDGQLIALRAMRTNMVAGD
jgi:hypothetical protein